MRVISGIQPTGTIHLGNYFGALKKLVELQENPQNECFYFIANQHAITIPQDSTKLKQATLDVAAIMLALGFNPNKCTIFVQSDVPAHTQLAWILNCLSPIGEMERMIQFKEKSKKLKSKTSLGLLTYPTLQAADIMLYKANLVPVGIDQAQHLELTRTLVKKFNKVYANFFPEPKTLHTKTTKIVGLDGTSKMSKSTQNYISIVEEKEPLWKKLSTAVTDPARIKKTDPGNPDICNIYALHKIFSSKQDLTWVRTGCLNAKIGCVVCKNKLCENINMYIQPFREKYTKWKQKQDDLRDILKDGAQKANTIANETLEQVYKLVGFRY
jgi:tryptophanyl-tRNA synthetase